MSKSPSSSVIKKLIYIDMYVSNDYHMKQDNPKLKVGLKLHMLLPVLIAGAGQHVSKINRKCDNGCIKIISNTFNKGNFIFQHDQRKIGHSLDVCSTAHS